MEELIIVAMSAAALAEIVWIYTIHRGYCAINRRLAELEAEDKERQARWNWVMSPEEKARLDEHVAESKRLIAAYWAARQV